MNLDRICAEKFPHANQIAEWACHVTKPNYAHTMYSMPLTLGNTMESNEDMVIIPRLNTLVRQANLRIAILEAIQKMDYDQPSENQALAINHFARGNLSLPPGSEKSLCLCYNSRSF